MNTPNAMYFALAAVVVAGAILFGLGLLFVRASRIERNVLVGACTLATSLLGAFILGSQSGYTGEFTLGQALSIGCLSILGFGVGWLYDRLAGPKSMASKDDREATLGAELAD
jgi:hypothetical protein